MRAASDHLHTADGLRLGTRAWLPEGDDAQQPRAVVVLVHGHGEHIGRYDWLAIQLVKAGYAVHGYDQRGHGYSQGTRAQVSRFEQLADDLGLFLKSVRAWHPGLPLVLLGHSMGGVVVSRAVQLGHAHPDLLVLSSPGFRPISKAPAWAKRLLALLAEPFPGLPTVQLDIRGLSRDPEEVEAYRLDPAVHHGPAKARLATQLVLHGELALAEADKLTMPVLLLHGKDDQVVEAGASGELHRSLHGRDAALILYDQGPHELFHDPLRERATADLLAWLDERLPAPRLQDPREADPPAAP